MVTRRTVILGAAIHRTVTAMVRMVTHIMGGTILGLGTGTVTMDIRTIVDQRIETKPTRPSTDGARLLFSLITLQALKTQAVTSRA
jgi:methylthioribose-1-phosphate isomerase